MQFTVIKAFSQKPSPNDWSSTTAKPDPFGHPEKDFVVGEYGDYIVQLNKYCAVRPQLLLHPKEFTSQSDPLTEQDFDALTNILSRLSGEQLAFYNCGPKSGSSQPYKHMQIIPKPHVQEFTVFPDEAVFRPLLREQLGVPQRPPQGLNVPFECLVAGVSAEMGPRKLHELYVKALQMLPRSTDCVVKDHNFILTSDWICLISRRSAGTPCATNSLGMMGMVWNATEEERKAWTDWGLTVHLATVGFPNKDRSVGSIRPF